MTINELIESITADKVALFFFFLLLPVAAFFASLSAAGRGNDAPICYIFSTLIFISAITGVLSLTFWLYSMLFEHKSLWTLDFSIYYLPQISMIVTIWLISRQASIRRLPWFGELYELLGMIAVVFGFILLIIHLQIVKFTYWWQVFLVFVLLFGLLKLGWERLMRMTR